MFELYDLLSFTYNNIEEIFLNFKRVVLKQKHKTINGKRSLIGLRCAAMLRSSSALKKRLLFLSIKLCREWAH